MQHELLRSVPVTIEGELVDGKAVAVATVNGTHQHRFDPRSRVSKALETTSPKDLDERLSGGSYFFVDGELVDFRDGNYHGFMHTDESIEHLADVLGITRRVAGDENTRGLRVHRNQISRDIILGKKWSDNGIQVPAYREGGKFRTELHFGWNPFVQTVNSAFMLWRLICTNGMEGLTSFLNTRIPLINRWEEHLDIANRQIQNKVNSMVTQRLSAMGHERATVAETMLVAQHAQARLLNSPRRGDALTRLSSIIDIVHPVLHLGSVYRSNVFEDKRLAEQMPAHLSTFDVFNMASEIRTHSDEVEGSTGHALDRFCNRILFDRKDMTQAASRYTMPQQSSFSDPDTAFFGLIH